jgi:hypothetical protein
MLNKKVRILLKGPCDLSNIEIFLAGASLTTEFNYIDNRGVVITGQNHSWHLRESVELDPDQIDAILSSAPFLSHGDFMTKIFENRYHVICYSLLQDLNAGLYRNRHTGHYISFSGRGCDITDSRIWDRLINGELQNHNYRFTRQELERFSREWEFAGATDERTWISKLEFILARLPGNPIVLLLTGSSKTFGDSGPAQSEMADIYREINPVINEFASSYHNVKIIDPTVYIHGREDYEDNINHYSRNVHYAIAGEICDYINSSF